MDHDSWHLTKISGYNYPNVRTVGEESDQPNDQKPSIGKARD